MLKKKKSHLEEEEGCHSHPDPKGSQILLPVASVQLICELPFCTLEPPQWRLDPAPFGGSGGKSSERSIYCSLELKLEARIAQELKAVYFQAFIFVKLRWLPCPAPPPHSPGYPPSSPCTGMSGFGADSFSDDFKVLQRPRMYTIPSFIFEETASHVVFRCIRISSIGKYTKLSKYHEYDW